MRILRASSKSFTTTVLPSFPSTTIPPSRRSFTRFADSLISGPHMSAHCPHVSTFGSSIEIPRYFFIRPACPFRCSSSSCGRSSYRFTIFHLSIHSSERTAICVICRNRAGPMTQFIQIIRKPPGYWVDFLIHDQLIGVMSNRSFFG